MKKKLSVILAAVLILSLVSLTAFAETLEKAPANIQLIGGGIEIIDPGVTPTTGYEDIKTTVIDFGTRKITGNTETYQNIKTGSQTGAKPEESPGVIQPVGLLLADARGLDGLWGITVSGSLFEGTSGNVLAGYTISFIHDGTIVGPSGGNTPVARGTIVKPVIIDGDGTPQPIFDSNAAGSPGTWGVNWNTEIEVLSGTPAAGKHSAVITWGINSVPTNP